MRRTVQRYNKAGATFSEQGTWGGRREKRCLMGFEQEAQLLQSWKTAVLEGGVLGAKQLHKEVEGKVGHEASQDYLWDLLNRHGWTKKAPRPEPPKAKEVKEKREAFKKSSCPFRLNRQGSQTAKGVL